MNKKLALGLVLIALLSATIAAYAIIQYVHFVENTAKITGIYGVKLVKNVEPYDQIVTMIDWGSLLPASTKSSTEVLGATLRLKNEDNMEIWVSWDLNADTPLPNGVTLTVWRNYDPGSQNWNEWLPGFDAAKDMPRIPSGQVYSNEFEFRLTIEPETPSQTFSFTININAHDSASG